MTEHLDENEDEAFGVTETLVDEVLEAVEAGDAAQIDQLLDPLHPADIAHLIEQVDASERRDLLSVWNGIDGDILSELDDGIREEIIETLAPSQLADAVRDLESDDVVDLVEYLDEEQQEAVLGALEGADRVVVEKALAYPEESAGRHMQVEVVQAPEHWTVGQMIDYLRSEDVELPDQFYHVILVDARIKPVAYVTLGRVLSARRDTPLRDIAEESFRTFNIEDPVGDVAHAFNHYHLISAPVVDNDDRLVGVITIDDAMILLDEEHEEDILRLAGVGEGSLTDTVIETTKQRMPWLAVNLITAVLASGVIGLFEDAISAIVALAVLMPIVASMGGNAGTQSLTVAVRAIATRDLTGSNVWRVIRRELLVGAVNGILFAIVLGIFGFAWFGSPMLGVVLAAAMIINLVVAGLAGTGIPVILEKLGIDPALASGAFVTTMTDVVGFFAFLGLASVVLL